MLDDVIKIRYFPRYWPFVRGIHRWIPIPGIHRWIPRTNPVTRSIYVFLDVRLNKPLSKQSRVVIWDAIEPIMTSF